MTLHDLFLYAVAGAPSEAGAEIEEAYSWFEDLGGLDLANITITETPFSDGSYPEDWRN